MMKHLNQFLGIIFLSVFVGFMFYKLVLARDSMNDNSHNALMVLFVLFVIIAIIGIRKIVRY